MAIVGIDLGTTTSEIAYLKDGKPIIIENVREGNSPITPSVILIENDEIKIGQKAKNQMILKPNNSISEIKRKIGSGETLILDGVSYSPCELSSFILKKLKEIGEFFLGEEITEAVITVPSNFNNTQRMETKKAGEMAGLKVERIINEPTAAALAYGLNNLGMDGNILVFDLGGGTFDVTILEVIDGVFDVKCSRGDDSLGGKDIDEILLNHIVKAFEKKTGVALDLTNKRTLNQLKRVAEEGKISLSSENRVDIISPYIATKNNQPIDLNIEVSREELEDLIKEFMKKIEAITFDALSSAILHKDDIQKVVLVGGATRTPCIYNFLNKLFRGKIAKGVNPDEAVALGAAIQAGIKDGSEKRIILIDSSNHSMGVEVMDSKFDVIIQRDTTIPTEKTKGYITVYDNQDHVDIRIYQGESEYIKDNTFIGYLKIEDIPRRPKGYERVDITFKYDLNGILKVVANVISTGLTREIDITLDTPIKEIVQDHLAMQIINEEPTIIDEEENLSDQTFEDEETLDENVIYNDTVQLVTHVNANIEGYEEDKKKIIRDKLGDLLKAVQGSELETARRIQLEIVSLL